MHQFHGLEHPLKEKQFLIFILRQGALHYFDEMSCTHPSLDRVNSKASAENLDTGQNRYKKNDM